MTKTGDITPNLWPRIRSAFDDVLEAPVGERTAVLKRISGGDANLESAVVALLKAHDALESETLSRRFLEDPAAHDSLFSRSLRDGGSGALPEEPSRIGDVFGGYRIVGRLGEGGMGIVYEAEQSAPRRRVALKVIRGSAWSDQRLRAFQREAEALARLRHPGIAAIYEAGVTGDGRHYFAMELVPGLALDQYVKDRMPRADSGRSALRERIGLFLEITDALAHAHRQGVIHRDLKPSNILVVEDPTPDSGSRSRSRIKLLDFGLARIVEAEGLQGLTNSAEGSLQGTLDYMSPEQARGNPDGIDSRSDIYSLGLIFYEMITDERPFRFDRADLPATLVRICEESPGPPRNRNRKLPADVETIAMKALEKDPARRYQSVSAISDDLNRYLNDLPIEARPATLGYQLGKIISKHRTAALLALALVLAVVTGAVGTTIGMVRARRSAAQALEQAETAEQIARFLEDLFRVSNPGEARANAITARELLDAGAARIDTSLADQPRVKGRLLAVMGNVYRGLGLYREARPLLEKALVLREASLGPVDPEVARTEFALAGLLRRIGDYDAARIHYERSLDIRRSLHGPEHADVAASLTGLANVAMETGDYPNARKRYEECIAIIEAIKGPDHPDLALYLSNLSLLLRATNDYGEARRLAERAVSILEKSVGPDHPDLAYDLRGLGGSLMGLGHYAEARAIFTRTLKIQEKTLGPDHTDVAETLGTIGDSYLREGGHADSARVVLERSVAIFEKALGARHDYTVRTRDNLSVALRQQGATREAIAMSEQCLKDLTETLGPGHPSLLIVFNHLGEHHVTAGEPEQARAHYERALAMADTVYGPEAPETVEILGSLADVCLDLQMAERSRWLFARAAGTLAADTMFVSAGSAPAWSALFDRAVAAHRNAGKSDSVNVLLAWKKEFDRKAAAPNP